MVCVFSFSSDNTDGFFKKSSDYSRVVVRKQQHYGAGTLSTVVALLVNGNTTVEKCTSAQLLLFTNNPTAMSLFSNTFTIMPLFT